MQSPFYIFTSILGLFVLTACEKTIILDATNTTPRVVIEGLLTNRSHCQYIKVSRSADFYSSGNTPRVTNAIVSVEDDLGNVHMYSHNPSGHADSVGYYFPEAGFSGVIGRTYAMTVVVDGTTFTAEDQLLPVTTIDSLAFRINEDEKEDPKETGKFYEILMFAAEPPNNRDYYKFDFYRNDSLKLYLDTDIYYTDDLALGEEINGVASPVYYALGDRARLDAYSLTRNGYVYYNDLWNLINNDGGMYGPPPANCRTNLTNGALGFFQVSALESREVIIEE
jgi:hypothetical protein